MGTEATTRTLSLPGDVEHRLGRRELLAGRTNGAVVDRPSRDHTVKRRPDRSVVGQRLDVSECRFGNTDVGFGAALIGHRFGDTRLGRDDVRTSAVSMAAWARFERGLGGVAPELRFVQQVAASGVVGDEFFVPLILSLAKREQGLLFVELGDCFLDARATAPQVGFGLADVGVGLIDRAVGLFASTSACFSARVSSILRDLEHGPARRQP